ncbi:hypothetical protein LUZ60_013690 [Juncus effusus]|nr:hypothetical protein LUZ60_013690 [Juncus effusus]
MTSRPVILVFLLLVLIITSQFEWKQQIEAEANPTSQKTQITDKEELIKEKIILSQEKSIQQLNELVQSLQLQLLHCRGNNNTIHNSENPSSDEITQVEETLQD